VAVLSIPNSFSPSTLIQSAQVNANFTAISAWAGTIDNSATQFTVPTKLAVGSSAYTNGVGTLGVASASGIGAIYFGTAVGNAGSLDFGATTTNVFTFTGPSTSAIMLLFGALSGGGATSPALRLGITGASNQVSITGGTGAPTVSALNGSLYLRADGSTGSTVLYINTSGASTVGTTWSPVTIP
jgi:hypothetical protein